MVGNGIVLFFLRLSGIPPYHIFLIQGRRFGCFHVLAIVNSIAMNTEVHASLFELCFSPDIRPGVGLQEHMVALFLVF